MEKPVEKKPDPPKPVAETKPKEEPKPIEKKPDPPKVDPIAEALKKEEQEAAAEAAGQGRDAAATAEAEGGAHLRSVEDRGPARQARSDPPGRDRRHAEFQRRRSAPCKGKAADNSATWGAMFQSQVERCWKKPFGGIESQNPEAAFEIKIEARRHARKRCRFRKDRPRRRICAVYQESALRAIIECQPYNLPAAYFEEWKYFAPVSPNERLEQDGPPS